MPRLLRSPLLHFLFLGALLFGVDRSLLSASAGYGADQAETRAIVLDPERVRVMQTNFTEQVGRPPRPPELDRMIDAEIEDEIFFREALARGLLERDPGVKTRLIQKMLFLDGPAENADRAALLARAVELGLHREDVVVRRILVQKMKLLGSALRPDQRVNQRDLERAYHAQHDRLRAPERRSVVQVFLSADRHGAATVRKAQQVRAQLVPSGDSPMTADPIALGDPFPLGHHLERRSQQDLDRLFGGDFSEAAFALPSEQWSGPIASAYGHHLIWVDAIITGALPPLEQVSDRLRLQIEEVRRNENLETLVSDLRTRYPIRRPAPLPEASEGRASSPTPNPTLSQQEPG